MKIGVDLRGLNYKHITGVNTYTLHFLKELYNVKLENPEIKITGVGLAKKKLDQICKDFSFINDLIDESIEINEYLKLPNLFNNGKLVNMIFLIKMVRNQNLDSNKVRKFDFFFLPQPKPFLTNPQTKLIVIFHDLFGISGVNTTSIRQRLIENIFVYKQLANRSEQIVVNSYSTANDTSNKLNINKSKIKLTYPALPYLEPTEKNISKPFEVVDGDYIVAISGIEPRKNWLNLVKAHNYLQNKHSDYNLKLVLIGRVVNNSYFNQLLRFINEQNVKGVIFKIDTLNHEKMLYIKNSIFTVYPSFWEGFGFPILESFKQKKPVVTSKISSMPELAKDSGVYVNPLNYKEIAAGIYLLFKDVEFRKKLTKETTKNLNYFNWSELHDRIVKIVS